MNIDSCFTLTRHECSISIVEPCTSIWVCKPHSLGFKITTLTLSHSFHTQCSPFRLPSTGVLIACSSLTARRCRPLSTRWGLSCFLGRGTSWCTGSLRRRAFGPLCFATRRGAFGTSCTGSRALRFVSWLALWWCWFLTWWGRLSPLFGTLGGGRSFFHLAGWCSLAGCLNLQNIYTYTGKWFQEAQKYVWTSCETTYLRLIILVDKPFE